MRVWELIATGNESRGQASLPARSLLKMPRQARSILMVHAILDAAILEVREQGERGASVNRIAKRASVSPGTLYQYFEGKGMLLSAVLERFILELQPALAAIMDLRTAPDPDNWITHILNVLKVTLHFQPILREAVDTLPLPAWNTAVGAAVQLADAGILRYLRKHDTLLVARGNAASRIVACNGAIHGALRSILTESENTDLEGLALGIAECFANLMTVRDSGESYLDVIRPTLLAETARYRELNASA